jgi:hypothetical protein
VRIHTRDQPPLTYPRSGFIGQWQLDLAIDVSWQSVGMEQRMGGTWGMLTMYQQAHADSTEEYSGWSTMQPAGSRCIVQGASRRCVASQGCRCAPTSI